jgi:hypothetical protein
MVPPAIHTAGLVNALKSGRGSAIANVADEQSVADMFQEPRTRALFTNVFPGDEKW